MNVTPGSSSNECQPQVVSDLLKSLVVARKLANLYNVDHPNTAEAIESLRELIESFTHAFERPTCVPTKKAVIVNEHYYATSEDAIEIAERLRARGAMAFTFAGAPPAEQIASFLTFLNTDPSEIRLAGGARTFLRKLGTARIVLTESIYASGEEGDEDEVPQRMGVDAGDVDFAIAAAIDWLSKQDDDDTPRLPITSILSDPDMAAKLIREAVTKLHASKSQYTSGELANEVVSDLKELSEGDPDEWDRAAPQIRKAIAKLPPDMRPAACGFSLEQDGAPRETADIAAVENMVSEILQRHEGELPQPSEFGPLFGANASGLLSNWKRELRPTSVIHASAQTLQTLMAWEESVNEHSRICCALSAHFSRALDVSDWASAVYVVSSLIEESRREDNLSWRTMNARSALASLPMPALKIVVENILDSDDARSWHSAADMVAAISGLAIELVDLLGVRKAEGFSATLQNALIDIGAAAVSPLAGVLQNGSSYARDAALDVLSKIGGQSAAREIANAIDGSDEALAAKALSVLPRVRIPMVTQVCANALGSPYINVRCTALASLGEIGDDTATQHIIKFLSHSGLASEKIAAVQALGRIGSAEAIEYLQKMAARKPLIGRSAWEPIRIAAEQAVLNARIGRAA